MNRPFFILYRYVVVTFEKDLDHILDIKIVNFLETPLVEVCTPCVLSSLFIFTYFWPSDYYNILYALLFI